MSKNKKKEDDPSRSFLLAELFKTFNRHPNTLYNYKQLARMIKPAYSDFLSGQAKGSEETIEDPEGGLRKEILFILAELQDKGDVIETERGKFQLKPKHAYLEGIIDITSGGAAYILSENDEDDVYIAPRNVKNALHGDKVKIYLYARHRNQRIEEWYSYRVNMPLLFPTVLK